MNDVVIDDADSTVVGYVLLWEGKLTEANFLQIFKSCYHMVGGSSELSLSKYTGMIMENGQDKN